MQLRHLRTIHPPQDGIQKVTAICWAPNGKRMAAVTTDRIVHLFDENGDRKDKFSTKPADAKGPKTYVVRGMAFSPDSTKLAVAQSDNIVFVYKLGLEWGDKKSICNKFAQSCSITCIHWPIPHPNEIVFGCVDGKVKVGQLRSNKAATLYATDSYVVSLTGSPSGNEIASGHIDNSIHRYTFDDGAGNISAKLANHTCVPYALAWGQSIVAAGNDCRVTFYDPDQGALLHTFDKTNETKHKEFTCASFNPSGESVVVGSFNMFHVFNYQARKNQFEEVGSKEIENFYTVTAMSWKPDGSRLSVGSLCGAVDMYDACIRRYRYKSKFEFTYVSLSQVIVKRLSSGTRIVLKSHFQLEILKINIYQDRYLIAHTPDTMLMGDLETCKLSEVPWQGSGNEKNFFDNPAVCMIYNAGELTLVEYGHNEILGSCRTEQLNPHLLSVRINDHAQPEENIKKIAYLIDLQTVRLLDLTTGIWQATINHDCKVDWLELNQKATKLLFRDKKRQLHLYNVATQERSTLLNFCSYVQWVPDSDVVVAQNRNNLCVWYSIDTPERVTMYTIKGDVEEIERSKGRTEVIVDEGVNSVSYSLDESLIEFGSAVEDKDYERAVDLLEQLELTPETEALWQRLSELSKADNRLAIAERCYAALGDVSKSRYLSKVNKLANSQELAGLGQDHYMVKAKLAMLNKQFKYAEAILLEQGQVEETMEMYQELHQWDASIAVAEAKQHPDVDSLRQSYYQWLIETNQEEKAGQLKEKEKDFLTAIHLYLKGGLPARAAQVVNNQGMNFKPEVLEAIAAALQKASMFEKAGDFFEKLGMDQRAMDAYRKGHAFRRAVDLARQHFSHQVVQLEEEWGDWLVQQKQMDAAINHFIEAGNFMKAIEASISAKQWAKAVQIIKSQDTAVARPFFKRIARHYEDTRVYDEAEQYYVKAGCPQDAVEMYSKANKWDAAHKVAVTFLSDSEVSMLYVTQAQRLESKGKFKEAEKLYLMVNEPDLAINMYKKARQYDNMIRLVATYRKDLLIETHLHLAQQLETESVFKQAEHHYIEAKDWKSAVNMYRANDMWDDAIRVAKLHGGTNASKQVAYAWAVSLGGEAGAKLLTKFGLIEQAIDYATESGAFDQAFEMARTSQKSKLPEVHYKHAMFLEDEGRFKEAEDEFVKAGKPKEAIDMYIHTQDWINAMRVAENHDPSSVSDVLVAQARVAVERKDYVRAEQLFVRAKKPDLAIKSYKEAQMWNDALRIAKIHMPHKLAELTHEYENRDNDAPSAGLNRGGGNVEELLTRARMLEESGQNSLAIDAYLQITEGHCSDMDQLEEIGEDAVKLAMNHVHERIPEVVSTVSQRLLGIKRYEQAAELLESIDNHKDAIDAYLMGGMHDKARNIARNSGAADLKDYVEKNYHKGLVEKNHAEELLAAGNVDAGLDLYAQRGEWEKCLELAQSKGSETVGRYAAMYAGRLLQEKKAVEAVCVLDKYGTIPAANAFPTYKRVAIEVIGVAGTGAKSGMKELRDMLYKLMQSLRGGPEASSKPAKEFDRLLLVAHYMNLRNLCQEKSSLKEQATKVTISLLRYITEVPADKGFYDAGMSCKEMGWLNMAFVFLNRYLDLSEAMEDGDPSMLDHDELANTDIPVDFPLPDKQFLNSDKREEVRDWVLQLSMDQQVAQELSTRSCENCNTSLYECALKCHNCKTESVSCIVTGYPVPKKAKVQCKSCGNFANREDWNRFVNQEHACPWCNVQAGMLT